MSTGHDAAIYSPGYFPAARVFHWITAAIVITIIPVGIAMGYAPEGRVQDTLFNLHRSLGVVLIPIVIAHLLWRLTHSPPPPPDDIPVPMQTAAGSHTLLSIPC